MSSHFYTKDFMTIRNMAADKLGIHPEFITVIDGTGVSIVCNKQIENSFWINTKNEVISKKGEKIEDDDIVIRLEPSLKDKNKLTISEIIICSKGNIKQCQKFVKYTLEKIKEINKEDSES